MGSYRVIIHKNKVISTLNNYPLYLDLSNMPSSFFSECRPDGGDIRCYDENNFELPRDVAFIDTSNQKGELHVKLPILHSTENTYITIKVDGVSLEPAFESNYGRNAVWSDYAAVYHMSPDTSQFPISVDDDFTGTNGDFPDPDLWREGTGDLTIFSDQLRGVVVNATDYQAIRSQYNISGDFDIQIDFNLLVYNPTNSWSQQISLNPINPDGTVVSADTAILCRRYESNEGRYLFRTKTSDIWQPSQITSTSDSSGKLRLVRSGSTITGYYWDGNTWVSAGTDPWVSGDITLTLIVNVFTTAQDLTANFDNFILNSGEIIWPLPEILDSTGNGNEGTPFELLTTNLVDGKLGKSISFENYEGNINCGNDTIIDDIFTGGGAFQCWFNAVSFGFFDSGRIYQKGGAANLNAVSAYIDTADDTLNFYKYFVNSPGIWKTPVSSVSLSTDIMCHINYNQDSINNDPDMFINGNAVAVTELSTPSGSTASDSGYDLIIGDRSTEFDRTFEGGLDELRFKRDGTLSPDWITTEHNNHNAPGTFYSVSEKDIVIERVVFNKNKIDVDLSNFPIYIDLSDLSIDFWNKVTSDGGDIRCYDKDENELAREVVYVDTVLNKGEIHVKIPSLSSTSNTLIQVKVDGVSTEPAFTSTYGRNAVWSDYEAVYHMNQDPSGTSPQIIDSTGNGNDGTSQGSMTSGDLVDGKIGKALVFDGIDDYLTIGTLANLDGESNLHISAIFTPAALVADAAIIRQWIPSPERKFLVIVDSGEVTEFTFNVTEDGSITSSYRSEGADLVIGQTSHIAANWMGGDNISLFNNGVMLNKVLKTAGEPSALNSTTELAGIAGRYNGGSPDGFLSATFSEVRIATFSPSGGWLSTEFNNHNDPGSFYTVGPIVVDKITTRHDKVDADLIDYPIYIDLSDLSIDFWDRVSSDGEDIRVLSNDLIELPREVVYVDKENNEGEIHVKLPLLPSSVDLVFYIVVDGVSTEPAFTSTYGRNAVWSDYEAVYHFNPIFPEIRTDFPENDNDPPNPDLWSLSISTGGDLSVQENKLRGTVPTSPADGSVVAYFLPKFKGDFDIEITWEEISNTPPSSSFSYPLWFALGKGSDFIAVTTYIDSGGNHTKRMQSSAGNSSTFTGETFGRARLTRVGSVLKGYFWETDGWKWNGDTNGYTFLLTNTSDMELYVRVTGDFGGGTVSEYSNLKINTGTPIFDMPQLLDSTGNGNEGVPQGDMTEEGVVNGKIGKAVDFDGVDDVINIGDKLDIGLSDFSFSTWFVNRNTLDGRMTPIGKTSARGLPGRWVQLVGVSGVFQSLFDPDGFALSSIQASSAYNDSNWHYAISGLDRDGDHTLRIDDLLIGADDISSFAALEFNTPDYCGSGSYPDATGQVFSFNWLNGLLSETRIMRRILSQEWSKAEFNNQNDPGTFYTASPLVSDINLIDFALDVLWWEEVLQDLLLDVEMANEILKNLKIDSKLAVRSFNDLLLDIVLSDGVVFNDLNLDIDLSDGFKKLNMRLDCLLIDTIPEFKSIHAIQLNSILKEI